MLKLMIWCQKKLRKTTFAKALAKDIQALALREQAAATCAEHSKNLEDKLKNMIGNHLKPSVPVDGGILYYYFSFRILWRTYVIRYQISRVTRTDEVTYYERLRLLHWGNDSNEETKYLLFCYLLDEEPQCE